MSRTVLCKLIQRKTYDFLSKRHTAVLLFFGFIILLVATLHFGETMMEWSKEKYAVVFSPYNNNIVGKNFRSMLCQYVPIDVVYTWVNGTDPKFLKELARAKEDYGFLNSRLNCSFSHCVKSHMVLVRPQLPISVTLGDLEEYDPLFQHISRIFVVAAPQAHQNISVLVFPDVDTAEKVLLKQVITMDGQNYTVSTAYVTDSWSSQNIVLLNTMVFLTQVPSSVSDTDILEKLPENIKSSVSKVDIHEGKSLAVLILNDSDMINSIIKLNNITFENKVASIAPAHLVIELPSDHEDISASRFTDNEELRYSLRSLEKHAPWVQHVYIITNGQIPYWLNLDNPWVTIITHEEIFPNKSHLPTFSSPAIECHLHRIPNLSKKFLYLNDDVMFGKDVWPEDFYTHTKGQKVYLSWPVPNCAEGCPSSWIRDGYCDKPCNNSQCQWDGGDCTADNPMLSYQPIGVQQEGAVTGFFQIRANKNYCNEDCADTWLADRYCDRACNVQTCGFDAGDCGVENFHKIPELVLSKDQTQYYLPEGEFVGYFNLTQFLRQNYSITGGFYEEHPVIRTLAISLKYSVIGIVLHPDHNATNLTITLKGEFHEKPFDKIIYVHAVTKPLVVPERNNVQVTYQTEETFSFEEFQDSVKFPKVHPLELNESLYSEFKNINISASQLPENIIKEIKSLKEQMDEGLLTMNGFAKKKALLIGTYMHSFKNASKETPVLVTEINYESNVNNNVTAKHGNLLPSENISSLQKGSKIHTNIVSGVGFNSDMNETKENIKLKWQSSIRAIQQQLRSVFAFSKSQVSDSSTSSPLKNYFKNLSNFTSKKKASEAMSSYLIPSVTQRHLLDTFGDSLRHVNKLYNEAFGYEARKVPSHIAHFVDKSVMSRLTERFSAAFDVTSSHKIRSSNDMQFSFSYYYYLMSEVESVEVEEIFDMFDTDKSGTWSDREIRTVLTRLYELPLDFSLVAGFEQMILNCSLTNPPPTVESIILHNERYYDSKLPLVTKSLICSCPPIALMLREYFGHRKQNAYEILGEEEVAFKMIHNNLSQVLGQIDDLRKHPKKFVCLNDNMNHGTQEAEVIRAVIQDFYESLFPTRSQFELPPEYRNRFLYVSELKEWRKTRDLIRIVTYLMLAFLIIFSVFSFWKSEMRPVERYARLRNIQNHTRNPLHV